VGRYDGFVALADRLIRKNGRTVKIRRNTSTTAVDVAKPWLGTTTTTSDLSTFAVFTTETAFEQFVRLASGRETPVRSNLERSGLRAIIPAKGLSFVPALAHKLVDGADTYEITGVEPIRPGDAAIAYFLDLGN
jgi:hypothetical protein